jgi:hypothetical protein
VVGLQETDDIDVGLPMSQHNAPGIGLRWVNIALELYRFVWLRTSKRINPGLDFNE